MRLVHALLLSSVVIVVAVVNQADPTSHARGSGITITTVMIPITITLPIGEGAGSEHGPSHHASGDER